MFRYNTFGALLALAISSVVGLDGPSSSCGVANFKVTHQGTPVGETKKINGVDMYFTYPPGNKTEHAIVYMVDAFGLALVQNRLLADSFARAGYLVVVPDYFKGDPAPADLVNLADFSTWISRHPASEVDSIIDTTIKYMRGNLGVKKLGSVGYCFGGKYVARFLAKGKGLDAGFVAHPSLTEKAEYEAISGPFSMAFAEIDSMLDAAERKSTESTLAKIKVPYQTSLYGSVSHGFGVRGNMSDKRARYAKEEAYLQAVRWLDTWLKE